MSSYDNRKGTSWGIVIVALIFFWPVGLILLFKKMGGDKTYTFKSHKPLLIAAVVMIAIGLLFLVSGATYDETVTSLIVFSLFVILGGVLLLLKAIKTKKSGERYRKLINITANQRITGIDSIASALRLSPQTVEKDLDKMIKLGYFKNAYIDFNTRQLVLPPPIQQPAPFFAANFAPAYSGAPAPVRPRVVSCGCCGANNTVNGASGICEYCGSALS